MTAVRSTRAIELPWHLRNSGRTLVYLLLGIPYGIAYLVVILAVSLSAIPLLYLSNVGQG